MLVCVCRTWLTCAWVQIESSTSPLNWRFRHQLAEQLPRLARLFSPAATFSVVASVFVKLLGDPVACVRETACVAIVDLLRNVGSAEPSWKASSRGAVAAFVCVCVRVCARALLPWHSCVLGLCAGQPLLVVNTRCMREHSMQTDIIERVSKISVAPTFREREIFVALCAALVYEVRDGGARACMHTAASREPRLPL